MMFNIPEYENVFRIPEKIFDLFLVQVYLIHERKNEGKAREDHTERDGKEDLRMAEKNNSLEKALTVLDLFQLQRRITLTSAAQETGYSTAAVSRIFNSLESTGYVYRDKLDGGYYLADKVYLLGRSTNLKQQLVNVIDEPIARLCMRTGLSVTVSIRDRVNSVTAMRKDPKRGLFLTSNVADSISLNCSASGKVLTAFSTDPDKLIESINYVALTRKTITDKEEFRKHISLVKSEGIAFDMEEITEGLVCTSVPVLSMDGTAICSISVSGYKERMLRELYATISKVKDTARECSRILAGEKQ